MGTDGSVSDRDFTIGMEEEFLLVDAETGALRPRIEALLEPARKAAGDAVDMELHRSQLEIQTSVCASLAELRAGLVKLRRQMMAVAEQAGTRIAATATHPFSSWRDDPAVSPKYDVLERDYQQLAREQLICGCHVHVGVEDPELAIATMNRVRPWLTPILALSGNSPYWEGNDTGYASYRTELWRRWPMAGTPEPFSSRAEYDAVVEVLHATGSIDDHARIYWDVRPSARFPTLEFRVTDVCLSVDEAVMVAGLVRALTRAAYEQAVAGEPVPDVRRELLRAATWRAARHGLSADLIDTIEERALPAREVVERFLAFLRPALMADGDHDEVCELVETTLSRGTGADRQRAVFARRGRLEDVVDFVVTETVAGG
jgi:glutamate---cysteine ligase / carboxylate-amine ligase